MTGAIQSEIAVYRRSNGALEYLAPLSLAPIADDTDLSFAPLPPGYADGLFEWDSAARSMIDNLDALRACRWDEVKAARDRAEWGGCDTPAGRIDTDPDSQRKLSGAVQMAMLARAADQPFTIDWTMKDNSTQSHDADAMIAMGIAVGMHVSICHAVATVMRVAIGNAASAAAIAAIEVDAGWP